MLWSPHWVFADYKIKYLKYPKAPDKIHSMSPIRFTEEHPEIVKWMSEWKMNDKLLNSLIKYVQEESLTQEQMPVKKMDG
ncbi:hypothetical protein LIT32_09765 [Bacillus sp. CMF21]|nr:hypothetical protein K8L98_09865 [Metabacillus dongyingensis]UOK59410.1 hypothetical protein MGI18_11470 [Bacillus sp. OVS6]USK30365.1 hypothetical protein LIT32_09765 [Bacillus sp. CMF21]